MIIYWILFLFCPLIASIVSRGQNQDKELLHNSKNQRKFAFLAMLPIIFFIGLRSGFADTRAYIGYFNIIKYNTVESFYSFDDKDIGFALITSFFKNVLMNDFHLWLFGIASFSCIAVGRLYRKYSPDFALSVFLFIATAQFTYLTNGVKQFLALSVILIAIPALLNKKYIPFCIAALIASSIHLSIVVAIPMYFICIGKPFSIKTIFVTIIFCFLSVFFANQFLGLIDFVFQDTQYSAFSSQASETAGSNAIRLIVSVVPVVLAFIKRKEIVITNDESINFFTNAAIINCAFMTLSTAISGIFFGRISIYFDVFNLILYPILLVRFFKESHRKRLKQSMIILYTIWFWYQMVYIWDAYYISDILGINTIYW